MKESRDFEDFPQTGKPHGMCKMMVTTYANALIKLSTCHQIKKESNIYGTTSSLQLTSRQS
jgi:hypothetical protein